MHHLRPTRSRRRSARLLCAALLFASTADAARTPRLPQADAAGEQAPSLEALLRRARAEEAVLLRRLEGPVRTVVDGLEAAAAPADLERWKDDLRGLGPAAAPLLVDELVPGDQPTTGQLQRARVVADVLREWGAPGVIEELVRLVQGQDARARTQAARVLPFVTERNRARAVLRELLAGSDADARLDAARGLAALARQGDAASIDPLRSLLIEEGASLVGEALGALAAVGDEAAEPQVRRLAEAPSRVLGLLDGLRAYYLAVDDAPRGPVARALVTAGAEAGLLLEQRRALLDLVVELGPSLDRDLERAFVPLDEHPEPAVRDEALITRTLLGDRSARRTLLQKYDDIVKARAGWPDVYEERAGIHMRIRQYDDAVDDYETAIALRRTRNIGIQDVPRELFVQLARAYCLDGKLRQAHEALTKAYPSALRLAELREDPAFQALVQHSRYGRLFD